MLRSENRTNAGPFDERSIGPSSNEDAVVKARIGMARKSICDNVSSTFPRMGNVVKDDHWIVERYMIHIGHVQLGVIV